MALTSLNGFLNDLCEFQILSPQQLVETAGQRYCMNSAALKLIDRKERPSPLAGARRT